MPYYTDVLPFIVPKMTREHDFGGRVLVALDLIWTIGWFAISLWFIFDSAVGDAFRSAARNMLFHTANTGSILYVLRWGESRWGAIIPFLFALVGDLEIGLRLTINLSATHASARAIAIAWAWIAVTLSVAGTIWFMAASPEKKKQSTSTGYEKL